MSEEVIEDKAEMHRTKVLAPSGELTYYIGRISKAEQLMLTEMSTLAKAIQKEGEMKEEDGKIGDSASVHQAIGEVIEHYARRYNTLSGGIDGYRSRQLTRVGATARSGITPDPEKKSWKDMFRLKKKQDISGEG